MPPTDLLGIARAAVVTPMHRDIGDQSDQSPPLMSPRSLMSQPVAAVGDLTGAALLAFADLLLPARPTCLACGRGHRRDAVCHALRDALWTIVKGAKRATPAAAWASIALDDLLGARRTSSRARRKLSRTLPGPPEGVSEPRLPELCHVAGCTGPGRFVMHTLTPPPKRTPITLWYCYGHVTEYRAACRAGRPSA